MNKLDLSAEELLYMSVLCGTDNIWNIQDPFEGMGEDQVKNELILLQQSLVNKGCIISDAEGGLKIDGGCIEIIDHCSRADEILILNCSALEEEHSVLRYYIHGDKILRFSFRDSAGLEYINADLMRSETEAFYGSGKDSGSGPTLTTSVNRLRRMGSLSRARFLQELKACGCNENLSLLIAEGLQGNSQFCSLLHLKKTPEGWELLNKLVTLCFSGGSLIVTNSDGDNESVEFTLLNQKRLEAELDKIYGRREIEAI